MARTAAAHRDEIEARPFRDQCGDLGGDDLDLDSEGAGFLIGDALVPDPPGLVEGLAYRPCAAGPCSLWRNQADMAADRDAVIGQGADAVERSLAVDGVGTVLEEGKGPVPIAFGPADFPEIVPWESKGIARHLPKTGIENQ